MVPSTHELRFGISRKHGGDRLLDAALLFTDALSRMLGMRVKLMVSFDYEHLLKTIVGGAMELAWLPPLIYARAQAKVGMPVAVCERHSRLTYRSAILVHEDSRFRVPADLRGARAAWTDRYSAAGYVFPRMHLQKAGIDPQRDLRETFVGSMVQAAAAVDRGEADCCATFVDKTDPAEMLDDLRRVFGPKVRSLRVLDQGLTDPIPADGISVGAQLQADQRTRITDALCNLHHTTAGTTALQDLMQADCLVRPTPELQRAIQALPPLPLE